MSVESQELVHVPLMGKTIAIEQLPGQDPGKRYGVIWDACRQPGAGLGYVVEFTDARTCHILAWMGQDGAVTECEQPLGFVPPGIPAISCRTGIDGEAGVVLARRHGSDELVAAVAYHESFPSQAAFEPMAGKGASGIRSQEALEQAVGPYAGRKVAWRAFLAVSYLVFYLFPRLGVFSGEVAGSISDVLSAFTRRPLADALDSLTFSVMAADNGDGDASGFERYAARMLQQAGGNGVRDITARHEVGVTRLGSTGLFWMRFGDDVGAADRVTLLAVEGCLNRLALVEMALRDEGDSTKLADCREGRCALEDQRVLSRVADRAHLVVDAAQEDNPYCVYLPVQPMRGGEWDVRTRFINACESLPVPYRLEYRFDCHAEGGLLEVAVGLPPAQAFPKSRWNTGESRWEDRAGDRCALAACYALRLAGLLAACGFGAGLGMRQVLVQGRAGGPRGVPVLSLRFERMSFLNRALMRIDSGALARVGGRGSCTAEDVASLLGQLAPIEAAFSFDPVEGMLPIEPLQMELPPSRLPLSEDDRFLPAHVAHLVHADRVRDLDIEGQNDLAALDEVHTVVEEAGDSRLLAMARLEDIAANASIPGLDVGDDIVAAAEAALRGAAPQPGYERDDDEGSRPVRLAYFPNLLSRCLVDVVSLREDEEFEAIPEHAYQSRAALGRLYLEDGDIDAALGRAAECVALAPTSAGSLLEMAQLNLASLHADQAIELICRALRVCARKQMASVLYAQLAAAYWQQGKATEALAGFVMARRFERGETRFDNVMALLLRQLGLEDLPSLHQAQATLRAKGIPIAPTPQVSNIVMTAAVGLVDARMFELAWPLVGIIGFDYGNDILALLGETTHDGIPNQAG